VLRVLTYHRIAVPEAAPALHPRLLSATPEALARQLDLVVKRYAVVSLEEVLAAARGGHDLPRRAVLLTFDDAYRDFLDAAWPLLRSRRLPAVMFVPTAFATETRQPFWWDRLHRCTSSTTRPHLEDPILGRLPLGTPAERRATLATLQARVKSLPHDAAMQQVEAWVSTLSDAPTNAPTCLSWDELRALAADGLAVCAHTRTHPLLTRLAPARLEEEVRGSFDDLRREMGPSALPVFAYPSGAYDDAAVEAVRRAGFVLAFTQDDGHNELRRTDLLRLRRTNITQRTTPGILGLRLQRWFAPIDRWRHHRRHAAPALSPAANGGHGPRRVAYVMSRFPKLTETFVLYEILALEQRGTAVEVFPLLRERQPVTHAEAARIVARARYEPFLSLAILAANLRCATRRPRVYFGTMFEVLLGTAPSPNLLVGALGIFPKTVRFASEMRRLGGWASNTCTLTSPPIQRLQP
jgi:peptidoglycan/xylan/chitin deacetylase (PgdA/CDA1 family)